MTDEQAADGSAPRKAFIDITRFASLTEDEQVDQVMGLLAAALGGNARTTTADDDSDEREWGRLDPAERRAALADPRCVAVLVEWLRLLDRSSFDDLDVLQEDLAEAELPEHWASVVVGSLFYSPDGTTEVLLVPDGDWEWSAGLRDERVLLLDQQGAVRTATIAELRADPAFWVREHAHACGIDDLSELPFPFCGDDWAGTLEDQAWGRSDWSIEIGGVDTEFDLARVAIAFRTDDHAPAGTWLSICCDGYSGSTGEIGFDVLVDVDGALFTYIWGSRCTFIGHADPGLEIVDLLAPFDPNNADYQGLGDPVTVSSEVLDVDQMRTVIERLVKIADVDDLDELEIDCVGWSGTATDLLDPDDD